ncbi:hypothetical protein Tco_1323021 [Tanacetum coccineum]
MDDILNLENNPSIKELGSQFKLTKVEFWVDCSSGLPFDDEINKLKKSFDEDYIKDFSSIGSKDTFCSPSMMPVSKWTKRVGFRQPLSALQSTMLLVVAMSAFVCDCFYSCGRVNSISQRTVLIWSPGTLSFLPKTVKGRYSLFASTVGRTQVEKNFINGNLKAITAYFTDPLLQD